MKSLAISTAALLLLSTSVFGQAPAQSGPGNNAINSPNQNNATAPVAGANSFTEGQAKSRIEASGYSNVSALTKDESGVWRGTAQRSGKSMNVSVDFQGNVIAN